MAFFKEHLSALRSSVTRRDGLVLLGTTNRKLAHLRFIAQLAFHIVCSIEKCRRLNAARIWLLSCWCKDPSCLFLKKMLIVSQMSQSKTGVFGVPTLTASSFHHVLLVMAMLMLRHR
ncbi:hypothetical protein GCK32_014247 [Trichostrongylus colubriformis]|uniref:Uncharacterized protein n=1 Tax=Trichostrongylus colubriformis TaxID=6319 RepID=A0AAN8FQL7_TRICO